LKKIDSSQKVCAVRVVWLEPKTEAQPVNSHRIALLLERDSSQFNRKAPIIRPQEPPRKEYRARTVPAAQLARGRYRSIIIDFYTTRRVDSTSSTRSPQRPS